MGALDKLLEALVGHTQGGISTLGPSVQGLVGALIVLTYGFMGVKWLVTGADVRSMAAGFFMKTIFVGFFVWLVLNWPSLYTLFPDYMIALGNKANGGAPLDFYKPNLIVDAGVASAKPVLDTADQLTSGWGGITNFGSSLALALVGIFLIVAFVMIALNVFATVVEMHMIALAAFPFLAAAVWNTSSFLAQKPIAFVFGIGAKLLVMTLFVGFAMNFYTNMGVPEHPTFYQSIELFIVAGAVLGLSFFLPAAAAALIAGVPMLTATMPIATAIAGVGAMQTSYGLFKAGGGAAAAAASGAASLTSQAAGKMGVARVSSAAKSLIGNGGGASAGNAGASAGPAAAGSIAGVGHPAGTPWAQRAASSNVVNMARNGGHPAIGVGDLASKLRSSIPSGTDGGGGGFNPNVSEDEK